MWSRPLALQCILVRLRKSQVIFITREGVRNYGFQKDRPGTDAQAQTRPANWAWAHPGSRPADFYAWRAFGPDPRVTGDPATKLPPEQTAPPARGSADLSDATVTCPPASVLTRMC